MRLDGMTAVVTGGASGMGKSMAMDLPIPLAPPVTTAVIPSSLILCSPGKFCHFKLCVGDVVTQMWLRQPLLKAQ